MAQSGFLENPGTAFSRQPLAEATGAGSETGALKLAKENQCHGANQPTASIQLEENLIETAMQDVEQQLGYEEAACSLKMKIQI